MKQKMYQQFVYKIESNRILGSKNKNLLITPQEARLNGEIISLADSNVLRAIDQLNEVNRAELAERIVSIRQEMRKLRGLEENKLTARKRIKELYSELDRIQLKTDYLMVIMSKPSDFDRINQGFSVNGIKYKRLVGTTNGVKRSTVVYCPVVNERGVHICEELDKRLNGGRDETKELVPAKFEAYKSLACSASIPVSMPKDILVVNDFVLTFDDDFIELRDSEIENGEPVMTEKHGEFELNAGDGFGLMCPELASRWSMELGLDYMAGGMCIRNLFCKGMVYTFDFHEFAQRYYDKDTITDVWGNVHTISEVELILPVSVMKLWDSYRSLSHYLEMCDKYGHEFAVTKACEKELENERTLNYQFIQSYNLTDAEIKELVKPTIDEIKEIIYGNSDKTLLFLHGACGKNYKFNTDTNYLAKAIMIEPQVAKDPYAVTTVYNMIKKRIDELKIGQLKVHGNYTMISGDPFAFCQSIFGCDVPDSEKGLLKAGEMYSKYWVEDCDSKEVVCFRAPMSCHSNIRSMNVVRNEDIDFWYQYMHTVNIINCHDEFYAAENGADNDGDTILVTDNVILLRNTRNTPAIVCMQKKADKCVISDDKLTLANKNSFGNDIGTITNRITSMYDIMSRFEQGSPQHETLEYRIKCGQLLQQSCIDKTKGIISNPMPKEWYDFHSLVVKDEDSEEIREKKEFNKQIVADKKPYFMIYIYPELSKKFRKYEKECNEICLEKWGVNISDLMKKTDKDECMQEFLETYVKKYPVTNGNGVMNRLCHYVEKEFNGVLYEARDKNYPYNELLASNSFLEKRLGKDKVESVKKLYSLYRSFVKTISAKMDEARLNDFEANEKRVILDEWFKRECDMICVSESCQCDTLLKVCYSSDYSKRFVWKMCGERIVRNLLEKNGTYSYFIRDNEGDVVYCGDKYKKVTVGCKKGEKNGFCDE